MTFDYSSIVSVIPGSADFVLLRRPEIPITITGRRASATYVALVDTGSDNTIFPKSVAKHLGISLKKAVGADATVFGGLRVQLLEGRASLRLESGKEQVEWKTSICFFDFASPEEECVILGHAGFLDYFTVTFDGKRGILSLLPNDDLPVGTGKPRRKRERHDPAN
jgi:hypothetical protein